MFYQIRCITISQLTKRIKLLEEIYKWHYGQIHHIITTHVWVQTSTKCTSVSESEDTKHCHLKIDTL